MYLKRICLHQFLPPQWWWWWWWSWQTASSIPQHGNIEFDIWNRIHVIFCLVLCLFFCYCYLWNSEKWVEKGHIEDKINISCMFVIHTRNLCIGCIVTSTKKKCCNDDECEEKMNKTHIEKNNTTTDRRRRILNKQF